MSTEERCGTTAKERTAPRVGVERIVMCDKCGSDDILTRYVADAELINSSSDKRVETEFIYSVEYQFFFKLKANKEHLSKHCRNCQFKWRENILKADT